MRRATTRVTPVYDSSGAVAAFSPSGTFERCTTWRSVNSASPHGPFSTQMPLHLKPPNGWCGASARWLLTHAVPHSS